MKSHQTSYITVLILSFLALALLAAWIFLGYKAVEFKKDIAVMANDARNKLALDTYLSSVRTALRDSKSDLAIINTRFIDKDGIPEYIDTLEAYATSTGVRADFTINLDSNENSREVLRVKISGAGEWEGITDFVSTLDSLPYASRIKSMSVSRNPASKDPESTVVPWSFSLELAQFLETK